jgi:hypothetical protein
MQNDYILVNIYSQEKLTMPSVLISRQWTYECFSDCILPYVPSILRIWTFMITKCYKSRVKNTPRKSVSFFFFFFCGSGV